MNRREFITRSTLASLLAGGALTLGNFGELFAAQNPNEDYDLVAVKKWRTRRHARQSAGIDGRNVEICKKRTKSGHQTKHWLGRGAGTGCQHQPNVGETYCRTMY